MAHIMFAPQQPLDAGGNIRAMYRDATIEGLKMAECSLFEASVAARDEGRGAMSDCLSRMLAAVRSMLADLGVQ